MTIAHPPADLPQLVPSAGGADAWRVRSTDVALLARALATVEGADELILADVVDQLEHLGASRRLVHFARDLFLPKLAEAARPERFRLLDDAAIEALPPPTFLVADMLPANALGEIHGPPGAGKSFTTLALAMCVRSGRPFLGHPVTSGGVVYVAAEGSAGLGARIRAWKQEHQVTRPLGVHFVAEPVQLLDEAQVALFLRALEQLEAAPALIVLDTLARCMVGGEENSAKDMGLAIEAAGRIRRATGAAVLLVHHTRKDGDSERGSTALRGAVEAMWSLENDDGRITLECVKQKDAPEFPRIPLYLKPVAGSCVVTGATGSVAPAAPGLTEKQRECLRVLQDAFTSDGASATNWFEASGIAKRTFFYARKVLVVQGLVAEEKRGAHNVYRITEAGNAALGAWCTGGANEVQCTTGAPGASSAPPLGGAAPVHLAQLTLEDEAYERAEREGLADG